MLGRNVNVLMPQTIHVVYFIALTLKQYTIWIHVHVHVFIRCGCYCTCIFTF